MGIWPTQREIAESEITEWFFPHLKSGVRAARAGAMFVDLVAWYAGAECLFLASALARTSGEGTRIVRFDREAREDESTLAHATLVTGHADGVLTGVTADILGRRPVADLARDLAVMGRFEPTVGVPVDPEDFDPHAERVALAVAGCLPWLRPHVPGRFRVSDADAYRCLEWICLGWGPVRDRVAGADMRWLDSLPPLDAGSRDGVPSSASRV